MCMMVHRHANDVLSISARPDLGAAHGRQAIWPYLSFQRKLSQPADVGTGALQSRVVLCRTEPRATR